jgi:hypothetical protein
MSEPTPIVTIVDKKMPEWIHSLIMAVWEVIKSELDAFLARIRR